MKATYGLQIMVTIDRDASGKLNVRSEIDGLSFAQGAEDLDYSAKLESILEKALIQAEKDAMDQYNSEMDSSFPEMHPEIIPS